MARYFLHFAYPMKEFYTFLSAKENLRGQAFGAGRALVALMQIG